MCNGEVLVNKEVIVYFNDGNSITRKDGICIEILKNAIIFKDKQMGIHQLVPFYKIIRVLEKPGGSNEH